VQGAEPITVSKANGIRSVLFNILGVGIQPPPLTNYPTDYTLVYDIAKTYFRMPLSTLTGLTKTERYVTASPIVMQAAIRLLPAKITAAASFIAYGFKAQRRSADAGGNVKSDPAVGVSASITALTLFCPSATSTFFTYLAFELDQQSARARRLRTVSRGALPRTGVRCSPALSMLPRATSS
jgi:hypothetical protein